MCGEGWGVLGAVFVYACGGEIERRKRAQGGTCGGGLPECERDLGIYRNPLGLVIPLAFERERTSLFARII